jgi:hypothetical protein
MERRGGKKVRIGRMVDYRRKEGRKYGCKRTKGKEECGYTLRTERNHISPECKHYQMADGEAPMNIQQVLVHQLHVNSLLHKILTSCY